MLPGGVEVQRGRAVLQCIASDEKLLKALGMAETLYKIKGDVPTDLVMELNNGAGAHICSHAYKYDKLISQELVRIQRVKDMQWKVVTLTGSGLVATMIGAANLLSRLYYDVLRSGDSRLAMLLPAGAVALVRAMRTVYGLRGNGAVASGLIKALGEAGDVRGARAALGEALETDCLGNRDAVQAHTSLVCALTKTGDGADAMEAFEAMRAAGLRPDGAAWRAAARAAAVAALTALPADEPPDEGTCPSVAIGMAAAAPADVAFALRMGLVDSDRLRNFQKRFLGEGAFCSSSIFQFFSGASNMGSSLDSSWSSNVSSFPRSSLDFVIISFLALFSVASLRRIGVAMAAQSLSIIR